jgi:glycosyltransferase involved in cell wall biosynthesis
MRNKNIKPKISIGMPVFNAEKYISEALDSLLAQTFTDFELIISDNASTDNTQEVCQEYEKKDSRVIYIRQPINIGPTKNFAFVKNQAHGEYFMWAAHDDRWDSKFIASTLAVFNEHPSVGLVFSNFIIRNLDTKGELKVHVKSLDYDNKLLNYIIGIFNMCPSLIYGVFRMRLIQDVQLESYDFADVQIISDLSMRTKIKVIDEYLYVAGTKGERKPYSLSHKKIQRIPFLRKQHQMLSRYFSFPIRDFLFLFTCAFMLYNKIRLWRY